MRTHRRRTVGICIRIALTGAAAVLAVSGPVTAQTQWPLAVWGEVSAGTELEDYLRLLQSNGLANLYPWSVRAFSLFELERMAPSELGHPWQNRYRFAPRRTQRSPSLRVSLIRPSATLVYNTHFPFGANDGAVWAGRGLTAVVQAGAVASYGGLSLSISPIAFYAENRAFPLQPNGQSGPLRYADGRYPRSIDRPQRFGDGSLTRLDPGQSTLRVNVGPVSAGASSANQYWGPARHHPILLGDNAPGFPHLFVGTASAIDLWLLRAHGRVVWGRLSQSQFSSVSGHASKRFMSGVVVVASPRGLPGLELGGGRFFHTPWPQAGLRWRNFTKPFESLLKSGLRDTTEIPGVPKQDLDNQLVSAFARWVLPESGFEVYGEYGREDHNWDLRDFILEPDHSAGYMIGFRKTWRRSERDWISLSAEVLDLQVSILAQGRSQGPFYVHSTTRQGHTHAGQILGSAAGVGGAASVVSLARYRPWGSWTVYWSRELRQDADFFWRTGVRRVKDRDVLHTLGIEALMFRGDVDIAGGLAATYELNRNLESDAFNINGFVKIQSVLPWTNSRDHPNPIYTRQTGRSRADTVRLAQESRFLQWYGPGSDEQDRERIERILGTVSRSSSLIQSSWRFGRIGEETKRPRVEVLQPELQTVWNSGVPLSLNDGALWAGRGASGRLLAGFRVDWGSASLMVMPQVVYAQNLEFEQPDPRLAPAIPPSRSPFSNPWHINPRSIDLPLRFGNRPFWKVDPGQTTIAFRARGLAVGASTSEQWWGPGLRNAIVMSNNAPGFPHLFLQTANPWLTALGRLEAKWLVGGLLESDYFDYDPTNNLRSLSAAVVTWSPQFEPDLTLGLARAVYRPARSWDKVMTRWLDVLRDTGRPNDLSPSDSSRKPGPDQIYSIFAQWIFPREGLEFYGEWARTELPASLRDLLLAPDHTQGYTMGFQWAKAVGARRAAVRLQGELTYLEKSTTFRYRPVASYYTSRAVVQGYTHRGQVLGAAVGPGGESQWLAVDYLAPQWRVGVFAGRIRWENDALYTVPDGSPGNKWCMHDVSIFGGVRAAYRTSFARFTAALSHGTRMNIHFRNFSHCAPDPNPDLRTQVRNVRLEFSFQPEF